jgi:hypothetical protein
VSVAVFEIACVCIVLATLAAMARSRPTGALVRDYAVLAVGAWLGEESSIQAYRFYRYASSWHGFVSDVPVLVPLIWPLVVLSARDVAAALSPPGASRARLALAVLAIVAFDASLVEVVAVRAGLWSWTEAGHLGVPLVGMLGWGYFALGASWPRHRAVAIAAGLASTHVLVLASWWLLFRWTARGELGSLGFVPLAAVAGLGAWLAARARRAGRVMSPEIWGPRVLAAGLFFTLLVATAPRDGALWIHTALVAVPYLVATSLTTRRGTRSPAAPPGATATSR